MTVLPNASLAVIVMLNGVPAVCGLLIALIVKWSRGAMKLAVIVPGPFIVAVVDA